MGNTWEIHEYQRNFTRLMGKKEKINLSNTGLYGFKTPPPLRSSWESNRKNLTQSQSPLDISMDKLGSRVLSLVLGRFPGDPK